MKIGFIGLGKMGQQMVARLLDAGHDVVVNDLNQSAIDLAVDAGAVAATDRQDLITKLDDAAIVWLMIPSAFVEAEYQALITELPAGSIIIDGGNSDYRDTTRRGSQAATANISFIDVGTSGGVMGLKDGFSMMIGGSDEAVGAIEPLILALARPDGWAHFGPTGSGHFIKMVHNGIEYGMMQAYAEGYHILQEGHDFGEFNKAAIAKVWQHGSIIASNLNEICGLILAENPDLENIEGVVAESGEARWTLETAQAHNIPAPVIQASLDVRQASQAGTTSFATKLLAMMRNVFGGHPLGKA